MKILHLINNLNREGAQVMVSNLVTANRNSHVQYFVCVRQPGGALVKSLRQTGISVIEPPQYFGFRRMFQSVNFIRNVCADNQICLIHAHMADSAFLGWLTARKLNIPLVISHHGHDILLKCNVFCRSVYYVLLNLAARYASMNVAVSPSVADRVRKLLHVKKQNILVISNGVRVPDKILIEQKQGSVNKNKQLLTLVSVGRLVPLKGHRQLIHAMSQLVNYFPKIRLYIVGGGEMEQELKQLATQEGVDSNIIFTGAVDDVSVFLKKADIYVSTSHSEGMPVSILEAMAWQLPVVASDIPGNKSVVKQDETGFLYELNNIDSLVKTVLSVEKNRDLTCQVVRCSRLMVEQKYSAVASEWAHELLYLDILKIVEEKQR